MFWIFCVICVVWAFIVNFWCMLNFGALACGVFYVCAEFFGGFWILRAFWVLNFKVLESGNFVCVEILRGFWALQDKTNTINSAFKEILLKNLQKNAKNLRSVTKGYKTLKIWKIKLHSNYGKSLIFAIKTHNLKRSNFVRLCLWAISFVRLFAIMNSPSYCIYTPLC